MLLPPASFNHKHASAGTTPDQEAPAGFLELLATMLDTVRLVPVAAAAQAPAPASQPLHAPVVAETAEETAAVLPTDQPPELNPQDLPADGAEIKPEAAPEAVPSKLHQAANLPGLQVKAEDARPHAHHEVSHEAPEPANQPAAEQADLQTAGSMPEAMPSPADDAGPPMPLKAVIARVIKQTSPGPRITETAADADGLVPQAPERAVVKQAAARAAEPEAAGGLARRQFEVIAGIARDIAIRNTNSDVEMRMALSPPNLGRVKLKLRVEEGVLSGSLVTETAATRHVLQQQLHELREALAGQGLQLGSFDVSSETQQGKQQRKQGNPVNAGAEAGDAASRDFESVTVNHGRVSGYL